MGKILTIVAEGYEQASGLDDAGFNQFEPDRTGDDQRNARDFRPGDGFIKKECAQQHDEDAIHSYPHRIAGAHAQRFHGQRYKERPSKDEDQRDEARNQFGEPVIQFEDDDPRYFTKSGDDQIEPRHIRPSYLQ